MNLSAVDNGPVKIRLQIRWKQSLLKPWLLNLMHGQKLLNLSKKQSADIQNQTVSSMVWSNSAEFGLSQLCGPEPRNIAKAHLPYNELGYGWRDFKLHALAELFSQPNKSGLVSTDGLV